MFCHVFFQMIIIWYMYFIILILDLIFNLFNSVIYYFSIKWDNIFLSVSFSSNVLFYFVLFYFQNSF